MFLVKEVFARSQFIGNILTLASIIVISIQLPASNLRDLSTTFRPFAIASEESRWVTIEYQLDLPFSKEEHLFSHYVQMWRQASGVAESYDELLTSFNRILPEKRGYPLLKQDGQLEVSNILYWIKKHQDLSAIAKDRALFKQSRVLEIFVDREKTTINRENQLLQVVYRIKYQLLASDKDSDLSDYDLAGYLPRNLHAHFYHIIGATHLKDTAVRYLANKELPRPFLKWKRVLRSVKHPCLGDEAIHGILTLERFLALYNPQETSCYLPEGFFGKGVVTTTEIPPKDVKVYPEYHELFKDGKLSLLLAIQGCNDRRYTCYKDELGHPKNMRRFLATLADYGFEKVAEKGQVSHYKRKLGWLEIDLTILAQDRPVYYEIDFWRLYPKADIVITNRLPLLAQHITKSYTPRYQIAIGKGVNRLAWGRILPQLDYQLLNFDAVSVDIDRLPPIRMMSFLEKIIQTAPQYQKPLDQWQMESDWHSLLSELEKGKGGDSTSLSTVAYFVHKNSFKPGKSSDFIDFSAPIDPAGYIDLLNAKKINGHYVIDHYLAYLYFTQHIAKEAGDFASFRTMLQRICRDQLAGSWATDFFFKRDCSPASLLASDKMSINGINFAGGSYVQLFYGKAGKPKLAYLAATTAISGLQFKSFYQDNGGVVSFYRNGQLKQGHLAQSVDYQGLPLLGGNGTAMIRFSENGALKSAQLRKDTSYVVGDQTLTLRGGWRGPHKVCFYPNGQLATAYLAKVMPIDGFPLDGVAANSPGTSAKMVSFHANGRLKSGMLASEVLIDNTPYPAGTQIKLTNDGKILDPLYRTTGENEYFWDTPFPAGSLYIVNPATSTPKWIRLKEGLKLRNHILPAGTEVTFNYDGYFVEVTSPATARAHIVFYDYSISVPEGSTLVFDSWSSSPSHLIFSAPISLGRLSFLPMPIDNWSDRSLTFHSNGRVAKGVLDKDANIDLPHFGEISIKGGHRVAFNDRGDLRQATLAAGYTFSYTPGEHDNRGEKVAEVHLPASTTFSLNYRGKLRKANLGQAVQIGKLRVEAKGELYFNADHSITAVHFGPEGGAFGPLHIMPGRVDFYLNARPKSIVLARPAQIANLKLPQGCEVSFYPSGKVKGIWSDPKAKLIFDMDGKRYTHAVTFYQSGKIKSAYLLESIVYGGIKLAGMDDCRKLRLMSPRVHADSCMVRFYEDGHSIMRGIIAENISFEERLIIAGGAVEFDEEGGLFFDL